MKKLLLKNKSPAFTVVRRDGRPGRDGHHVVGVGGEQADARAAGVARGGGVDDETVADVGGGRRVPHRHRDGDRLARGGRAAAVAAADVRRHAGRRRHDPQTALRRADTVTDTVQKYSS